MIAKKDKFDPKCQTDSIGLLLGLLTLLIGVSEDISKAEAFVMTVKEGLEYTINQPFEKFAFKN